MTDKQPPEEIHMWFADNGNIRKWSFEPFPEAEVKYIRSDVVEYQIEVLLNEWAAERSRIELTQQAQELGLYDTKGQ